MGSSSVMSGWWGVVVSSLFDVFGDGGSVTSVHAVRACLVRLRRLSKFRPHFVGGGGGVCSTTTTTTTTNTTTTTTTTY